METVLHFVKRRSKLRDVTHEQRNKRLVRDPHFRPDEHCWYFTRDGLMFAMNACGFALVTESSIETELGREDIGTFAFRRNSWLD